MIRVAVGVSDWPEEFGRRFDIVTALDGESDEQLIARALSHYAPGLIVEVEEREES